MRDSIQRIIILVIVVYLKRNKSNIKNASSGQIKEVAVAEVYIFPYLVT